MHRIFKIRKLQKDNRGSAIVLVIVVIAFIGMLLSMMMYMALYNYQMKAADFRAQNNFYSAEMAMDEIRAGLQAKTSAAVSQSYLAVMQNYSSYTDTQRSARFQYTFFHFLSGKNIPAEPAGSGVMGDQEGHYSIAMLQSYITQEPSVAKVVTTDSDSKFDIYTDHMSLENVKLVYTNPANGDISIIETDINIMLPDMDFNHKLSLPEMVQYALIGNRSIQVSGGDTVITSANIYGGRATPPTDSNGDGKIDDLDDSYGIQVQAGAALTVKDSDVGQSPNNYLVVSNDNVDIEGTGAAFQTDGNINFWAKGILVNATSNVSSPLNLQLSGTSYVQDDLTAAGKNANIAISGAYYGYGHADVAPENSSAILINGTDTSLDLSQLSKLALAGNAYIGMSNQAIIASVTDSDHTSAANKDVPMGESLTAKAAQLAYLVPPECIGWTKDAAGNPEACILGKNPVSQIEYENRYQNSYLADKRMEVNLKETVAKLGKKLSDYGIDEKDPYHVVVTQGTNWRYYYLNFASEEDAGKFFRDYYAADYAKMDKYIDNYISTLKINTGLLAVRGTEGSFRLELAGNIITPNSDYLPGGSLPHYTILHDDADAERQRANGVEFDMYEKTYDSLCRMLSTDYSALTEQESTQDIFTNLIDQENMTDILGESDQIDFTDAAGKKKVVIAGNGVNPLDLGDLDKSVCLIIAKKDVVVDRKFKGTIITDGQIRITNGADISCSADDVSAALGLTYTQEDKTFSVANMFTEGADMIASKAAESTNDSLPTIDSAKLITYSNWVKK